MSAVSILSRAASVCAAASPSPATEPSGRNALRPLRKTRCPQRTAPAMDAAATPSGSKAAVSRGTNWSCGILWLTFARSCRQGDTPNAACEPSQAAPLADRAWLPYTINSPLVATRGDDEGGPMSLLLGFRVVQVGPGVAAAVCGRLFAELGASVTCDGTDCSTSLTTYLNHDKTQCGGTALREALAHADIIVCEGGPAALRERGHSPDDI